MLKLEQRGGTGHFTDNGLEFTDRFVTKDKQVSGKHKTNQASNYTNISKPHKASLP
jgi:hypothetical protein